MTIWMEVTTDDLSLPVAIAMSRQELARKRGVDPDTISKSMWGSARGLLKEKYIKVKLEDEE